MNTERITQIDGKDMLVAFSSFICCYWVYDFFKSMAQNERNKVRLAKIKRSQEVYEMERMMNLLSFKAMKEETQSRRSKKHYSKKEKVETALRQINRIQMKQTTKETAVNSLKKEDRIFIALLQQMTVNTNKGSFIVKD